MKILTATAATQGQRDNDFNHCAEGELVWLGLVCAIDRADPDGGCGCGRSFTGLSSRLATTTAMVRDIAEMSRSSYAEALRAGLAAQRWHAVGSESLADELTRLVNGWPAGAVVERRLDIVTVREWTIP
ncbi:hypothetical protein [Frankia sp. BMG5.23]|uniref:DUF7715 family protein n=2 Tax=Frankiaceae TaxID=74712 RepID=UPI0004613BC6|nr:hypothetical protein [Frankia sp. BMG5.23]KDA44280.1 hypothetical protein BMG523Draft_00778 [Frankia sp. BMG5.23]